jgi:hypothetical protein
LDFLELDFIQSNILESDAKTMATIERNRVERLEEYHPADGSFLVKWCGYPSNQSTWEPEENLPWEVVATWRKEKRANHSARIFTKTGMPQPVDQLAPVTGTNKRATSPRFFFLSLARHCRGLAQPQP